MTQVNVNKTNIYKYSFGVIGEDSLPQAAGGSSFLQAVDSSIHPKKKPKRGQGSARAGTRGPGRPPLSRAGTIQDPDSSDPEVPRKRRGRPPLHGKSVVRKGLDRTRKVVRPSHCHLCELPVKKNDKMVDCRTCGNLAHDDCEMATGEDCGNY